MTPYAVIGPARIYHGTMQTVMASTEMPTIQTLVTDGAYWGMAYAQSLKVGFREWSVEAEALWQAQVLEDMASWLPTCYRAIEYAQGRAWFFGSPQHLPILIRTAYCLGWPLQRIWYRAGAQGLVQFGRPIGDDQAWSIDAMFRGSSHPTRTDPALLEAILSVSDPDGLVLDPFMGQGGTLVAATRLGMPSCGIEKEQSDCDVAVEHLRAVVRQACCA